jgi:pyruvate/2-oxoglutarate dehydrogenase complex dihydrolipoamide dehydrogenase (E3) component
MDTGAFDFVVIGGGSAGYAAARTAVGAGLRTAVVEGGPEVGGLCILRGCMPSKTLIESANRYMTLRRAEEFGLRAGEIGFDSKAILARKRRLISEFAGYRQSQLTDGRFAFHRGLAAFAGPNELEIRGLDGGVTRITGRVILVSTGSTINRIPVPGLEETGYWTSDDLLEAESLPGSLIVLGGGAVGLEAAHYAAALGRKVTVIQRSLCVLKEFDNDVSIAIQDAFKARGIEVFTGTKLTKVERVDGRKKVWFEHESREMSVKGVEILQALGRRPALEGLSLEKAGLHCGRGPLETNEEMQTRVPHIFAAGDVCGMYDVVHIAVQQGEIAARNAARFLGKLKGDPEKMDYRMKLFAVFTEPQAAMVGWSESELKEKGVPYCSASYPFNDHGKSLVMGEEEGFVKMLAAKGSGEILGASVVGPHASELIHELAVAMRFHGTARDLLEVPHYHPTLSEIWTYPAEELAEQCVGEG